MALLAMGPTARAQFAFLFGPEYVNIGVCLALTGCCDCMMTAPVPALHRRRSSEESREGGGGRGIRLLTGTQGSCGTHLTGGGGCPAFASGTAAHDVHRTADYTGTAPCTARRVGRRSVQLGAPAGAVQAVTPVLTVTLQTGAERCQYHVDLFSGLDQQGGFKALSPNTGVHRLTSAW